MLRNVKNILFGKMGNSKAVLSAWQLEIIKAVDSFTMTSYENLLTLINSVQHIVDNNIEGDLVECGVWKGGSIMAAAKTLLHLDHQERCLYLYDTFENFSTPGNADISHDGKPGKDVLANLAGDSITWKAPDIDSVKNNLLQTGYPEKLTRFIKGEVEKTIPGIMPEKISLLRLDTDWYASTKHELEWLFPRLSKGGVLIIDDYGYWKGCRKAVDEYFLEHNITTSMINIDFSARMIFKE